MSIEDLRLFCLSLPKTTEGMKWGDNLCFMVDEKIFLLIALDNDPISGVLKVKPEQFDELIEQFNGRQASHFAKRQWMHFDEIEGVKSDQLKNLVLQSYRLVVSKLTASRRKEIQDLLDV